MFIIGWIVEAIFDALLDRSPSDDAKARHAYRDAWRLERGAASEATVESLREHFKMHHCPSAYDDPPDASLAPWLDAWARGLDPKRAREHVRAS